MIVDMRLRPAYKSFMECKIYRGAPYYPTRMGFPRPPSADRQSLPMLFDEMDEAGIDVGVIPGRSNTVIGDVSNDDIHEFVREHPGRFVWLGGLTAEPAAALAEMERVKGFTGMCGFAMEPPLWTVRPRFADDPELFPIYERCMQLGFPMSISLSAQMGPDLEYSSPIAVQRVAMKFPDLNVIIAHAGWPWVLEALGVAFKCKNVYISPDLYMVGRNMPGAQEYIKAAHVYMGDRLLFGTAYPSRPLIESVAAFREWEMDPGVRADVMGGNAARLLKIAVPAS